MRVFFLKFNSTLLFFIFYSIFSFWGKPEYSQIIPPDIKKTKTGSWATLGLSQNFGTKDRKNWNSVTYFGFGRKSNPDGKGPFYKPSIFILTQEFKNRFRRNWEYNLALLYARQNEYIDSFPFNKKYPSFKQEFRVYGRISYLLQLNRLRITPTFRQEVRKFYTPGFDQPGEDWQLRSRFRLQFSINLDGGNIHRIISTSEQLFSTSRNSKTHKWSDFEYKDSRFALYYSFSPKKTPITLNIGYMYNLVGRKDPFGANIFAFDFMLRNPF